MNCLGSREKSDKALTSVLAFATCQARSPCSSPDHPLSTGKDVGRRGPVALVPTLLAEPPSWPLPEACSQITTLERPRKWHSAPSSPSPLHGAADSVGIGQPGVLAFEVTRAGEGGAGQPSWQPAVRPALTDTCSVPAPDLGS